MDKTKALTSIRNSGTFSRKIESGKVYRDMSGRVLPAMKPYTGANKSLGDFFSVRLGDGRYYTEDGKCVSVFGDLHEPDFVVHDYMHIDFNTSSE